jgi:hypothetical protein
MPPQRVQRLKTQPLPTTPLKFGTSLKVPLGPNYASFPTNVGAKYGYDLATRGSRRLRPAGFCPLTTMMMPISDTPSRGSGLTVNSGYVSEDKFVTFARSIGILRRCR